MRACLRAVAAALVALLCLRGACAAPLCARGEAGNGCGYAIATMATTPAIFELGLFLTTLHRFDADIAVYVGGDVSVSAWVRRQWLHARVEAIECLAPYERYGRDEMKRTKFPSGALVWTQLQLEKTKVMAAALEAGHDGVLFADADVIWLAPMPRMAAGVVGLSPCLCNPKVERRYGRYNGGHVFARNALVLESWRKHSQSSRYFEQSALEDVARDFGAFDLDPRSNVEWLNLLPSHSLRSVDHTANDDLALSADGAVTWLGEALLSIHVHLLPTKNQPAFQHEAVRRIAAVLNGSLIHRDLCALHVSFCGAGDRAGAAAAGAAVPPACAPPAAGAPPRAPSLHVLTFRSVHGPSQDNYYHFFFGVAVPLLHRLAQTDVRRGDVVLFNDVPSNGRPLAPHRFLPLLLPLVQKSWCVHAAALRGAGVDGVALGPSSELMNSSDGSQHWWPGVLRAGAAQTVSARHFGRPELGIDHHLYACGRWSAQTRADLGERVDAATRRGLEACACDGEALGRPRVLYVHRRVNPSNDHHNRSLPNEAELISALRSQPWSADVDVVVDAFEDGLCGQWCSARAASVVVAQHGAAMTNLAFLRGARRSAVVEFVPAKMAYKTMFHCLAGLREAHYARIVQADAHGAVDAQAVADAVGEALRKIRDQAPLVSQWPARGHWLHVCHDDTNQTWAVPIKKCA